MRFRGIAFKTFLFTSLLITAIVILSFGSLYFTLPAFYRYQKEKTLMKNADTLVKQLKASNDAEECARAIFEFSEDNNSQVLAYDEDEYLILDLSSPFLATVNVEQEIMNDSVVITRMQDVRYNITYSATESETSIVDVYTSVPMDRTLTIRMFESDADTNVLLMILDVESDLISRINISGTLQPIDEAKGVVLGLMPYVLLVDIGIVIVAAYFYTRRFTRPILAISDSAQLMQEMIPGIQSGVRTNDELGLLSGHLDHLYNDLCENINQLRNEMDKVNRMEQSKTDFMRAASHELKTPIAALNGIIEGMIDNVGVFKNRDKYLEECKILVERLSELTAEILNVARLENEEKQPDIEYFSLNELLECVLRPFTLELQQKKLQLEIDSFQYSMKSDKMMINTTLSNLISNAVRYTPQGGRIRIRFILEGKRTKLIIENEASPLKDSPERLMEPFFTSEYSRDKEKSGTGLGLYIVKRNLEALELNYDIAYTTEGTFCFTIFLIDE